MRPAEENNARRDRVAELSRQGHTIKYIAKVLYVATRTVERDRAATGCAPPKAPRVTEDEFDRAKAMLEDGVSYEEAGRTLGRCSKVFRRRFPGYTLTKEEAAHRAMLGRQMAQLMKDKHL